MPSAQTIMLAVHAKRTEQLDIKSPILNYIRATYDEADANDAADDLEGIQGLRNELVTAQGAAGGQGLRKETLIK
jgi:programmed cell death 6-interacting protein